MKIIVSFLFSIFLFFNSCAQQRFEKPPKPSNNKLIDKLPERLSYYLSLDELEKKSDSLYYWKRDKEYHVIDGKTTLFNYYQTSGDDNPKLVPYNYAEGEFLKGKYNGIWTYYNKSGKITRKEKWDNGKLIYKRAYK